jgi:hypothetical protein
MRFLTTRDGIGKGLCPCALQLMATDRPTELYRTILQGTPGL